MNLQRSPTTIKAKRIDALLPWAARLTSNKDSGYLGMGGDASFFSELGGNMCM